MDFEKYQDLFSFNRCLLEDDYIDGTHFQLKDKRKAGSNEFVSTFKLAEAKDGKHKLAFEEKVKVHFKEFGGGSVEAKFKNNGSISIEKNANFIQQFNGLQNTHIFSYGEINNGALSPFDVGVEHKDDKFRFRATASTSLASPQLKFFGTWRACANSTFGAEFNGPSTDLLNNSTVGLAYVSYFKDSGLQWGAQMNASVLKRAIENQRYTFHFNHKAGSNTVGAKVEYDHSAKKWASQLGLQLKQEDHTWKLRFHDTGLARLALQWQLHKVCQATLNTSLNLRDIPAGSIGSLPLNLALEVKY